MGESEFRIRTVGRGKSGDQRERRNRRVTDDIGRSKEKGGGGSCE